METISSMTGDAPTLEVNSFDLDHLMSFVHHHQHLLRDHGAIKLRLTPDCQLALKKRRSSPPCTHIQQIRRLTAQQEIYSMTDQLNYAKNDERNRESMAENEFWSSLANGNANLSRSGVSILPEQSLFHHKWHQKFFSIHRIPKQSLLELAGPRFTEQFHSNLFYAHGPGAIFPLSMTPYRLASLIYHHDGGQRCWYVIPSSQQEKLTELIQSLHSSSCIEHGQILINPSILQKYNIQYVRVVQNVNEFVLLSEGAFSESFASNYNWTESVDFASVSWIRDGHAAKQHLLCQCPRESFPARQILSPGLFPEDSIDRYIQVSLINDHYRKTLSNQVRQMASVNFNPRIQLSPLSIEHVGDPSTSVISPVIHRCTDENEQRSTESTSRSPFQRPSENASSTTSSVVNSGDQSLESFHASAIPDNEWSILTDIDGMSDEFCSLEDLADMESYLSVPSTSPSTQNESFTHVNDGDQDGPARLQSAIPTEFTAKRICHRTDAKKAPYDDTDNRYRTLLVSGLRHDITNNDLHRLFVGCTKATIKQCKSSAQMKYAFILYATESEARHSFARSLDYRLLGPSCQIKYAGQSPSLPIGHQLADQRKLVVRNIPQGVTEDDLRRLFSNCQISNYCPARAVDYSSKGMAFAARTKILWGYAFLAFNTVEEAVAVVERADQNQINGRTLLVSFYDKTKNR